MEILWLGTYKLDGEIFINAWNIEQLCHIVTFTPNKRALPLIISFAVELLDLL